VGRPSALPTHPADCIDLFDRQQSSRLSPLPEFLLDSNRQRGFLGAGRGPPLDPDHALAHFNCVNFEAIVHQLLFTYADLVGPKITFVRTWVEGSGDNKTIWTEYLLQWESGRANAFLRDVLNNYRAAGGPPCDRLQN